MVNDNIIVLSNTPFDAEDERGKIFMDDLYGKILVALIKSKQD